MLQRHPLSGVKLLGASKLPVIVNVSVNGSLLALQQTGNLHSSWDRFQYLLRVPSELIKAEDVKSECTPLTDQGVILLKES